MSRTKCKYFVFTLLILCLQTVKSQESLSPIELGKLLDKAERQSQNYSKVFQNLSAEELKTKVYYKSDGSFDEKRTTKSIFVVYQSPNTNNTQEFRSVLEFNGTNVARSENEAVDFFEKLAKKDTTRGEYEKLRKESLRFDGQRNPWGITYSQPRPFMSVLRNSFKFQVIGKEKIEGREAWIIEYEQTKSSTHILSNPTEDEIKQKQWAIQYNILISDEFRPSNPLLKGKIWIDAETAQMRRNEFKVFLYPQNLSQQIVAEELLYEYQPSKFGIVVPKRIWLLSFAVKGKNDKSLSVKKDIEFNFDYSNFSEFKTYTTEQINQP